MSRENVEIVRKSFLAVSGGDPMAGASFYDPAIEWDMSGVTGWLEKRVYRGPEVIPFLQAWADSWQDWHFDLDEVRDGGESECSPQSTSGEPVRETGAHVDQRRYFALTLRGGRAVRVQMFCEHAEALKALGLEE